MRKILVFHPTQASHSARRRSFSPYRQHKGDKGYRPDTLIVSHSQMFSNGTLQPSMSQSDGHEGRLLCHAISLLRRLTPA